MSPPYSIELTFAGLSMLAQAKKHDETTFGPRSQILFGRVRSILTGAGIDVDGLVNRMLASERVDGEEFDKLSVIQAGELEAAFRAAGLESSLPERAV